MVAASPEENPAIRWLEGTSGISKACGRERPREAGILMLAIGALALSGASVPWNRTAGRTNDTCFQRPTSGPPRWVFVATPEGEAPSGGWPVVLSFVTDMFPTPRRGQSCGPGGFTRKHYGAHATPIESMASCVGVGDMPPSAAAFWRCGAAVAEMCIPGDPLDVSPASCRACAAANSSVLREKGCAGSMFAAACEVPGFDSCQAALDAACGDAGAGAECSCALKQEHVAALSAANCTAALLDFYGCGGETARCMYDQQAGQLWDSRVRQLLIDSGVAVVQVNPLADDNWAADPVSWRNSPDRGFLRALFAAIANGELGALDARRLVLRGWSAGAALVSWLFQVERTEGLPAGVAVKGGILLSGGSYTCYTERGAGPPTSCSDCIPGGSEESCFSGSDPRCSSCSAGPTYCSQCCPRNFTEAYFEDHPEQYAAHPPVFLAQTSTRDAHADLCATRNYYDTMVAHGARAVLALVPTEDERCFCVGTPGEKRAAGAPTLGACDANWHVCKAFTDTDCCVAHTMGFAAMLEPLVGFVLEVT